MSGRPAVDVDPDRLLADLAELSAIGGNAEGGVDRVAWTAPDLEARRWLLGRMRDCGLESWCDAALNVFGRAPGGPPRRWLVGSHADTVANGGRLDGAYGVVAALEVVRALIEAGHPAAPKLAAVSFSDEEGVRFEAGYLGSRALTGELDAGRLAQLLDRDGVPVEQVLAEAGVDIRRLPDAAAGLAGVAGFLELHVEQGPRLEAAGLPIGVVTAILGIDRYLVSVRGRSVHAGTHPFRFRQDAGRAAGRLLADLREVALEAGEDAVANAGAVRLHPGWVNLVAGSADLAVELRHPEEEGLRALGEGLRRRARRICREEGCTVRVRRRSFDPVRMGSTFSAALEVSHVPPARMDPVVVEVLERSCRASGVQCLRMPAGAAHDAGVMSRHVATGMLFVPSLGGVTHSPEEDTDVEHLVLGARVLLRAVIELAERL